MNQWPYCNLSYYFTYVLGYQQPTQVKSNLGTVCHKTLEVLANCKKLIQDNKPFSLDDNEIGTVNFSLASLYTDDFVEDVLEKCFNHYTNSHKEHDYKPADYKFCQNMVYECLTSNNGYFDPRRMNIVKAEKSFDIEITEPWAKFEYEGKEMNLRIKGTMDLITEVSSDTLEYVDYKSGQRKDWATGKEKTYEYLYEDSQLLLYYYAMRHLYPEYKNIIMTIFFLRDGGPFSLCYEDYHIDLFLNKLKNRFEEIRNCDLPKPINPRRSDFRCTRLCHFYKNNWPGTDVRMCNYVEDHIKTYGIDVTGKELKKPGFKLDFYSEPGSTAPK